jgi:hypothetical protein
MINKTLIAAAAVVATVAGFSATAAHAGKPNIDVYVDLGGNFGYGGYGYYDSGYPIYDEPHHVYKPKHWGISCEQGAWSAREAGFRRVRVNECDGRSFTYTGKRHGERFLIKVSRSSGDIISVRRINWN